jgi:hypothetical protein
MRLRNLFCLATLGVTLLCSTGCFRHCCCWRGGCCQSCSPCCSCGPSCCEPMSCSCSCYPMEPTPAPPMAPAGPAMMPSPTPMGRLQ